MQAMDRKIIRKIASELNLSEKLVERTYMAYWRVIREHMASMPFKSTLTDEEFNALQPNVNIPSIGKFYVTLDRYRAINDSYNKRLKRKEDDNAAHKED